MTDQNFENLHPRNRKGEFTDKPGAGISTESDISLSGDLSDWEAQADRLDGQAARLFGAPQPYRMDAAAASMRALGHRVAGEFGTDAVVVFERRDIDGLAPWCADTADGAPLDGVFADYKFSDEEMEMLSSDEVHGSYRQLTVDEMLTMEAP